MDSHITWFFYDFPAFFPRLGLPLRVWSRAHGWAPRGIRASGVPQGKLDPITSFSAPAEAAVLFLSWHTTAIFLTRHFTHWVQLLPSLEMLLRQYCHSDALTQTHIMCFLCHLVASSRAGREGKLILVEFPLCIRYASKTFPMCYSLNIIYAVVCVPKLIIL